MTEDNAEKTGNRAMRRQAARAKDRKYSFKDQVEIEALRGVIGQINATAQLAVRLAKAAIEKEITFLKVENTDKSILIVETNPGLSLDLETIDQLSKLFSMPVMNVEKGTNIVLSKGDK